MIIKLQVYPIALGQVFIELHRQLHAFNRLRKLSLTADHRWQRPRVEGHHGLDVDERLVDAAAPGDGRLCVWPQIKFLAQALVNKRYSVPACSGQRGAG